MLNDYKEMQPNVYKILAKAVNNERYSHAYLFEGNEMDTLAMAIAFAKSVVCPQNRILCDNEECTICKRVDNGNYPEIVIVEPDGLQIKKEKIIDLQKVFAKKPSEGKYLVYIIKDCDKLNKVSANAMLKFLEEPNDGIIAILLTRDVSRLLKTILSRCQVLKFHKGIEDNLDGWLLETKGNEELLTEMERIFKFVLNLEKRGYGSVARINEVTQYLNDKKEMLRFFDIMLLIYKKALLDKDEMNDSVLLNDVLVMVRKNSILEIARKIEIIMVARKQVESNVNTNMMLDRFLIRMESDSNA